MGAIAELAAYVSRFAAWVTYPAMPRYFFHVHLGQIIELDTVENKSFAEAPQRVIQADCSL